MTPSLIPDVHKKVFIVQSDAEYERMFHSMNWETVHSLNKASLIQFTGGEDVSPDLYGEYRHPKTYNSTERDKKEMLVFHHALKNNIPMAGICRGAQFLNVMCGGKMYQDVNNHIGRHMAKDTMTGELFEVTSTHHQMMRPAKEGVVLVEANESTARERILSPGKTRIETLHGVWLDIEVVYYAEQNCLCFQPHPEHKGWFELRDRYFDYIETFLFQNRFIDKSKLH